MGNKDQLINKYSRELAELSEKAYYLSNDKKRFANGITMYSIISLVSASLFSIFIYLIASISQNPSANHLVSKLVMGSWIMVCFLILTIACIVELIINASALNKTNSNLKTIQEKIKIYENYLIHEGAKSTDDHSLK